MSTQADEKFVALNQSTKDFSTVLEEAKKTGVGFEEDGAVVRALDSMSESAGAAKTSVEDTFLALQTQIDTAKGWVGEDTKEWNILDKIASANLADRDQKIAKINNDMQSVINTVGEATTQHVKEVAKTQEPQIADAWNSMLAMFGGEDLPKNRPTLPAMEERVEKEMAKPIRDKLAGMQKEFPPMAADIGLQTDAGLGNGITDNAGLVTKAVDGMTGKGVDSKDGLIGTAKGNLGVESPSTVFAAIGKYLVEGFAKGISENVELAKTAIKTLTDAVINAIKTAFQSEDGISIFTQLGTSFMQGLSDGIANNVYLVTDAMMAASTLITDGFKANFAIEEISGVFSNFGLTFMQGLSIGISENVKLVHEVLKQLEEAISENYNKFMEKFKEVYNKDLQALKTTLNSTMSAMKTNVSSAVSNMTSSLDRLISKIEKAIKKLEDLQDMDVPTSSSENYGSSYSGKPLSPYAQAATLNPVRLAHGGILRRDTLMLGGEYAGAASNPEIVSPQNIMYETAVEANAPLVSALSQKLDQVIKAIQQIIMVPGNQTRN